MMDEWPARLAGRDEWPARLAGRDEWPARLAGRNEWPPRSVERGTRAVSTVVSYLMVLGIVTVLTTGLFVSTSGFVEDQRQGAVRSELEVVGNQLAADLAVADRLARAGEGAGEGAETVQVTSDLPDRVAGATYEIEIVERDDGLYRLVLRSLDADVSVTVLVRTRTPIETGTVDGGDVRISYDGSGPLEVDRV